MRILLIGDQSIQNDAVKSILDSETGREIWHLTHAEVQDGVAVSEESLVSLVDLNSFPGKPVDYVQYIKEKNLSKYLVALCADHHNGLRKALNEAGADYCFSIDSEPEELIQVISHLN